MKKTIFLTGAKGFIGSHLLNKLTDYEVYCASHNELPATMPNYIIHLAATTTTSDSFLPELFENNIVYAKQIMSIPTRIVYASSTSAAELTNPYAYTKCYLEWLGENHPNATGLRFFNVYGPGNNKGIVKKAIESLEMFLFGGGQVRDFIYIDDVVNAIINSLDSREKIIEVGTGIPTTIYNAIFTIERLMRKRIKIKSMPASKTDMAVSVASPGIPNCLSFEQGLKLMI